MLRESSLRLPRDIAENQRQNWILQLLHSVKCTASLGSRVKAGAFFRKEQQSKNCRENLREDVENSQQKSKLQTLPNLHDSKSSLLSKLMKHLTECPAALAPAHQMPKLPTHCSNRKYLGAFPPIRTPVPQVWNLRGF